MVKSAAFPLIVSLGMVLIPSTGLGQQEAAPITIQITKQDCQRLVRHQAREDVEFKPGRDVRGRSVAPADLDGGNRIKIPDVISFDLQLDMSKYLANAEDQADAETAAALSADKATAAATAAETAAVSAEAAASAAQTIADTAAIDKAAADTALATAKDAWDTNRGDAALLQAYGIAKANVESATATLSTAQSDAATLGALAETARTAADSAVSAGTAREKAGFAEQAADAAAITASAAISAAGNDAAKVALLNAGNTASTDASTAADAANASLSANAATVDAIDTAQKRSAVGGNAILGRIEYNLLSRKLTFNGEELGSAERRLLTEQCQKILSGR